MKIFICLFVFSTSFASDFEFYTNIIKEFKEQDFDFKEIQELTDKNSLKKIVRIISLHANEIDDEKYRELIDRLKKSEVDFNFDDLGAVSIINAARSLDVDAINFFITLGVDVNQKDIYDNTALLEVIFYHWEEDVKKLNEEKKEKVKEIIKILFDAGADPNSFYADDPLLCYAVQHNFYDLIFLLMTYGANINAKDSKDKSFLDYANENPKLLNIYEEYKA